MRKERELFGIPGKIRDLPLFFPNFYPFWLDSIKYSAQILFLAAGQKRFRGSKVRKTIVPTALYCAARNSHGPASFEKDTGFLIFFLK